MVGFGVAHSRAGLFIALYFFSFVCDELDGRFARMLNQTTTFGVVLDMVTDRLATACLLALVGAMFPGLFNVTLGLVVLDVFSHWFQMYTNALIGEVSHKKSSNWIVNLYYKHRLFMGFW